MTDREKIYAVAFYEGLIARLKLEQVCVSDGHESARFEQALNQFDANQMLAQDSVKELAHLPDTVAAWQGWLDGVRRFAALGQPSLPRELEEKVPAPEAKERSIEQLVADELNGWMPEFYDDLPRVLDLAELGVRSVARDCEFLDTWMFLPTIVSGLDETSGNFGDGFTQLDRDRINRFVDGDWMRAVQLIRDGMAHLHNHGPSNWPL